MVTINKSLEYMFSGSLYEWLNGKKKVENFEEFETIIYLMLPSLQNKLECVLEEVNYETEEPIDLMTQLINCKFFESKSEIKTLIKNNALKINNQPLKNDSKIDDFTPRIIPNIDTGTNVYVLKIGKKNFEIFFLQR